MRTTSRNAVAASAVALLATGGAEASLLGVTAVGGSEAVLTLVNTANNETISQDLGDQISQLAIGDSFSLGASVLSFINGAGGLGNVRFGVVAGAATNGTSTGLYLQSSDNLSLTNIANGVRGTWFTTLSAFLTGPTGLNSTDAGDTDPAVDAVYGGFAAGTTNRNYLSGTGTDFMADWGTSGTCVGNDNVCNLVGGSLSAQLYAISFGTSPTGFAAIQRLLDNGSNGGARATLDLQSGSLRIEANVVPVPAAVWLMGSALGLLGLVRRRMGS